MDYTCANGEEVKVGDAVEFTYTQGLGNHTGIVIELNKAAIISVDKSFWHDNDGNIRDGIKTNYIAIKNILRIIKNTGESMSEEIEVGSKVIFKSKKDLVTEFGADSAGNPATTTRFNNQGEMDHLYGSTGEVTSYNKDRGFIEVEFDKKIPGKRYVWGLTAEMFELNNGSYIPATAKLLRTFMKGKTDPTQQQVWTAIVNLKRKLTLNPGYANYLYEIYSTRGFDELKRIIEHGEPGDLAPKSLPAELDMIQAIYPKIDIEVLCLVSEELKSAGPTFSATALVKGLVSTKDNSALLIEIDNTPFTPIKRIYKNIWEDDINAVWKYLEISNSFIEKFSEPKASLKDTIGTVIIKYLEDNNKSHLSGNDKVKLEA